MSCPLRPIGERIVAKKYMVEQEKKLILVPESAQHKEELYQVVNLGDEVKVRLYVGDVIVTEKYAAREVKVGDESLYLINLKDVMGVLAIN